mmetsp:Transcript_14111/g.44490  ORF Transcript_14111/g.44490 Transcript_14111/m.44490 type:complete len:83 (-) Transcript_14111:256-504(-)
MAGVKRRRSLKAAGKPERKRTVQRPKMRTAKHKKASPSIKNVASLAASGEKNAKSLKKLVAQQAAAKAQAIVAEREANKMEL